MEDVKNTINETMNDYDKLMRDVIEKYNITMKFEETIPGSVLSDITCIELDLRSVGIASNIILKPNQKAYNTKHGLYDLLDVLARVILRHELMSFCEYATYKKSGVWDDIMRGYEMWKDMKTFIEGRMEEIVDE